MAEAPDPPPAAPPVPAWRIILTSIDFYRDVLVTILGVLIALAIGEWADSLRASWKARAAVADMKAEAVPNVTAMIERMLVSRCVVRRLDQLERRLAAAEAGQPFPPLPGLGRPATRPLTTVAWSSAVSQGLTAHIAEPQRSELRLLHENLDVQAGLWAQERTHWATLQLATGGFRRWPEGLADDWLLAIARARETNEFSALVARQALRRAVRIGIPLRTYRAQPLDWDQAVEMVLEREVCRPLRAGLTPS